MEKIVDFFYGENVVFRNVEIPKLVHAADYLCCEDLKCHVYSLIDEKLGKMEFNNETISHLIKVQREKENENLRKILYISLANKAQEYINIWRILTKEELAHLILRNSKGDVILYKSYQPRYCQFIESVLKKPKDISEMQTLVKNVLLQRSTGDKKLFYGYPLDLFLDTKEYRSVPDNDLAELYAEDPSEWHLKKIYILEVREESENKSIKTLGNIRFEYEHKRTGVLNILCDSYKYNPCLTFTLSDDELITEFHLCHRKFVYGIKIITNRGRIYEFGNFKPRLKNVEFDKITIHDVKTSSPSDDRSGIVHLTGIHGIITNVKNEDNWSYNAYM